MHHEDHPILHTREIADLRPTQMTVGLREVARKRASWRKLKEQSEGEFLGNHMIPVVIGPKNRAYIIDNHHLARALHDEGVKQVLVRPFADLQTLAVEEFWSFIANRNWMHLYDGQGTLRPLKDLPKSVSAMADDPYRSLAGDVRRAGGCAKDQTPYAEFLWADFLRRRVKAKLVEGDYEKALAKSIALAHSHAADHLPGWCGVSDG